MQVIGTRQDLDSESDSNAIRWLGWYLLFVLIAVVALSINPLKKQTLTPLDMLAQHSAWKWTGDDVAQRDTQRSDILNALLPAWLQAREQLRSGHLPLWNDTSAGGTPLTTPNVSTYTPGFLVFAASPDPARGFMLATLLNISLCGFGMFVLLRRFAPVIPSLTGAVTFQFSGFFAGWLYWPHTFTSMWLPFLLWAIHRCIDKPGMGNALWTALFISLLLLGGFPFLAELGLLCSALFALVSLSERQCRGRRLAALTWLSAGGVLGLLLAILPVYELFSWMQHFDLSYREGRASALEARDAVHLLPWHAYGNRWVEKSMYVGALGLLAALAGGLLVLLRWHKASAIHRFALLLLCISAALVFELIPPAAIAWVPGFSFNSWSRGIVLLELALSILMAYSIHRAMSFDRPPRHWLGIAVSLLCLLQMADIAAFFRQYNGATPARMFYPSLPVTDLVLAEAGPFDTVIADWGFWYGGTLGGYGLREWYAHQFHTKAGKTVLASMVNKPFRSRTVARFRAKDIRTDSPYLRSLNVRYLLLSDGDRQPVIVRSNAGNKRLPLSPLANGTWLQTFNLPAAAALQTIRVRFATYHQAYLPGTLRLCVYHLTDKLGCGSTKAYYVRDNQMTAFNFDEPLQLAAGNHAFSLEFSPGHEPFPKLSAWGFAVTCNGPGLALDGSPTPYTLDFEALGPAPALGDFRFRGGNLGTSIYENTQSPAGPYMLDRLQATPGPGAGDRISVRHYRPGHFELSYKGQHPGWLVVPMRYMKGWTATINTQPAHIILKDGLLPAVRLNGPAEVVFDYKPAAASYINAWLFALAGWLGLMMTGWILTLRHRPAAATMA